MVGEIRDNDTAELAVHAALTGHLVLSTLHTNSASGAIPRVLDMGVETFLLVSTLNVVLAQRLVRKICSDCKEETTAPQEILDRINEVLTEIEANKFLMTKDAEIATIVKKARSGKIKLYKGKGCVKCENTGYRGRLGIFEVLSMSDEIAHLALESSPSGKIEKQAIAEGMLTLLQDGFLRILEGDTTLEEVVRVAK